MNCRAVSAQLTAYLDGELSPARASAVRGHLRLCDACRAAAEDHAVIRDSLGALERPEPTPAVWEGVLARLGDAEIADARRPWWRRAGDRVRPHLVPAGLATAACAAAVLIMHVRAGDDGERASPAAVATGQGADPAGPPGLGAVAPARAPDPAPVAPPAPRVTRDATLELADEAARLDARFRETTAALLPLARAELHGAARTRFDREVAALEAKVVRAPGGAARDRAWHALIAFLERTALAVPAPRVAMHEGRR